MGRLVLVLCLVTRAAFADPTQADADFARGRQLLADGKYAEACAAFESSLRLDFQFGTLWNVADCNAKVGKLATSLAAWRRIAKEDRNSGRAQKAADMARQLEPRVPRVQISITPTIVDTQVTLDGKAVTELADPVPVDLGAHQLVISAPDRHEVVRKIEATREGEILAVVIELPPANTEAPVSPPPPVHHSSTGKIVTALGGGVLVAGLVVGGLAYRAWHDAETTSQTDVDAANADLAHVRLLGNVSTALIAAGAITVGIGVYLWRSGSHAATATASLRGDRATVALAITF